ncbi:MAG TPA: ATP phosphoribosyltransferase regulatory subunit, partial [Novosphingobium sp.]|nr:ATP phosphoribosyltransferase regulatory subunit [Novosphingobium sp.]
VAGRARLTLDPSERHGFEYQSWFGFTLYAAGVRGALGRGGTYRITRAGAANDDGGEAATGFSLYPDALAAQSAEPARDTLFLPLGHDAQAAARLRAIGWRTVAALAEGDDAASLGCTHRLAGREPVAL